MSDKIMSWDVLREDGKNIAWVNGRFVGVVSDEQVSWLESVCPTLRAVDCGNSENSAGN